MSDFGPPPAAPVAAPVPPAVPRPVVKNTVATVSLVLGILAMVGNVLFIPGLVAFVLGIVGLVRSGRTTPPVGRGKAVAGIVLGVVSGVTGVFLTMAMFAPDTAAERAAQVIGSSATDGAETDTGTESEVADETAAEPAEPEVSLSDFESLAPKAWESIAKRPDAATGQHIVVFAEVTQFDTATGDDAFRANVGADQPTAEYELETNTMVTGDADMLGEIVVGDVVRVHATVAGSFDYDTQIGGSTVVPLLSVADVKVVRFKEAESKDGSTSFGSGTAIAENLGAGQKAEVAADFWDVPGDAVFRVASVERYDY